MRQNAFILTLFLCAYVNAQTTSYRIGDFFELDIPTNSFYDCSYNDTVYDVTRNNNTANVKRTFQLPCKFKELKEAEFKTPEDYTLYSKLEVKELDKNNLTAVFKISKISSSPNKEGIFEDTFTFVKWKSDIEKTIQAVRNDSKSSLKPPVDKKLQKLCEEFDRKTAELTKKMENYGSYEVLSKIESEFEAKQIEAEVKKATNRLFFHMANPKYKKCPESTNQIYFPNNETLRKEFNR